jgi:hypothetical protein
LYFTKRDGGSVREISHRCGILRTAENVASKGFS